MVSGHEAVRSGCRNNRPGRLFWANNPELERLEERTLLSLTFTDFPLPMVEVVQPQGITAGADGNLWFTEIGAGRIGRETPSGVLTEFPLPADVTSPGPIAAGPDGNLWVGASQTLPDSQQAVVVRITPGGSETVFPVPSMTFTTVGGLTAGLDGALWFAGNSGKVGRITTAGVVSEVDLPRVPSPNPVPGTLDRPVTPGAITTGPDGNLWFTTDIGQVYRMSTAGAVTGFPVDGLQSSGAAITSGPDGALWFTGLWFTGPNNTDKVGRITTSGVVSEFTTFFSSSRSAITTGPDGNLWITDDSSLGKMTPAGVFSSVSVPGNFSTLGGVALGPDGNLWVTLSEDGYFYGQAGLARVDVNGAVTSFPIPQRTTLDPNLGVPLNPTSLVVGQDGAFWFTDNLGIGRMTTDGSLQHFALTTPGAQAVQITNGPAGSMWFSQEVGDLYSGSGTWSIGRITTAGAITVHPLPPDVSVDDITEGRNGSLWFTETLLNEDTGDEKGAVGRLSPSGVLTTYAVSFPSSDHTGKVGSIAIGPDGNIWFTGLYSVTHKGSDTNHQALGQITARGQVRVFSIPAKQGSYGLYFSPSSLITGPDGLLWFPAVGVGGVDGIARMSTSGKLARTIPATIDGPLVRGPNHQAWFPLPAGFGSFGQLGLATRSGIVVVQDVPDKYVGYYALNLSSMVKGPDGNLWFTDGKSNLVRITGQGNPAGSLDNRHRPKHPPDYQLSDYSSTPQWTNTSGTSHPTFAGVAAPGSEVTLWVQALGASQPVAIGSTHANRVDGSWTLTSHRHLGDGTYAVVATRKGDTGPPSVLYSFEPDYNGDLTSALVIDTSRASRQTPKPTAAVTSALAIPKATLAHRHAASHHGRAARPLP